MEELWHRLTLTTRAFVRFAQSILLTHEPDFKRWKAVPMPSPGNMNGLRSSPQLGREWPERFPSLTSPI